MASAEEDYYELLGIEPVSTLKEIKRAYRRKALECHPDKVGPDDLKAAELFFRLTKANDVLSNSESRARYDDLHKSRRMQQARFKEMDAERRKARQDLTDRELLAANSKRQKTHSQSAPSAELQKKMDVERLREEGFRGMQAMETEKRQCAAASVSLATLIEDARRKVMAAELMDCTLKIKWKKHDVVSEDIIRDRILHINSLLKIEKILMGKSFKREANVIFKDLYSAKHHRFLLSNRLPFARPFVATSFPMQNPSSASSLNDYEERTLQKMKKREREALNREILEAEASSI
ncbi:hypothetical protein BASA61_000187 [Batrachochytrium salamandrivorans]|nr:hypothetical protein BASA62_000062 [Batrachochytrium salamandrivorans]KAH6578429.1 hypothetical protein BASA61_000187 [Batrachochytrium salamandrivorans]